MFVAICSSSKWQSIFISACKFKQMIVKGEVINDSSTGLEGIVATTSSISSIIDDTLTYVGYNIDDLTENASFEEVIYLLWHLEAA